MAGNKHRGELTITMEGAEYILRPDFTAIEAVDDATEHGIIDLARKGWESRSLPLKTMALIVTEGMKAQGRATKTLSLQATQYDRVRQLIAQEGVAKFLTPCLGFLAHAINGGVEESEGNGTAAGE